MTECIIWGVAFGPHDHWYQGRPLEACSKHPHADLQQRKTQKGIHMLSEASFRRGAGGPSPPREKKKRKKGRKKEKREKREKKRKRKKGTSRMTLNYYIQSAFFFQFFNSPVALKIKKNFAPPPQEKVEMTPLYNVYTFDIIVWYYYTHALWSWTPLCQRIKLNQAAFNLLLYWKDTSCQFILLS